MKYQLLLFTIYLITIAYGQDNACTYTTSEKCEADTNCEWEEGNPGKCEQDTTKDCSTLDNDEEHCKGGCTVGEGTCANTMTDATCTTAGSTSTFNSEACTNAVGCVVDGSNCKAKTGECDSLTTEALCVAQADSKKCGWTPGKCENTMTDATCATSGVDSNGDYDESTCNGVAGCIADTENSACIAKTGECDEYETQSDCEQQADTKKCGWTTSKGTCANTMTDATCATAGSTNTLNSEACTNAVGCVVDGSNCKATTGECDSLTTEALCVAQAGSKKCGWTPGSCINSCISLNEATCGSTTGCSWKGKTNGSCKKSEDEKKEEGSGTSTDTGTGTGTDSGSGSDSSNYVKFGNYLLVLFLFLF